MMKGVSKNIRQSSQKRSTLVGGGSG